MLTYAYKAKDSISGNTLEGEVQADSQSSAAKLLIDRKLFPITIDLVKEKNAFLGKFKLGDRIKTKDRVIYSRQLSTLINAGLPLARALHTLEEQIQSKTLREINRAVIQSIEGGMTLSAAMAQYPKAFNQTFTSIVAAGESSGTLDAALKRLADQQEKDAAVLSKVRGALVYPAIVLVVIIVVVAVMLVSVLPQVGGLYKDLHKELPIYTRFLLGLSNFIIHFWWLVVAGGGAALFGLTRYFKTEKGATWIDKTKLKVPLFGQLFSKLYMARFARTLGTLLATGIPLLEAMRIVGEAVNNRIVKAAIGRAATKVKGGRALSQALEVEPSFTKLLPQMIKVGEESGAIDDMLDKVAGYYEGEVEEAVKNLSTTIEPLLMVVMGVVVAFLIAAILLPIYNLVGAAGSIK